MEKFVRCRDLGPDGEFEACWETPKEALKTSVDHARAIHGLRPKISLRNPDLSVLPFFPDQPGLA